MLFVGDDWAEDHHDIEIEDESGRRLARVRLPEGLQGITRLHALIAGHMPADWADLPEGEAARRIKVGIETERGPWVQALVAAGYEVFPVNPMSVARYRERHSTSGAKSDAADAHLLAEIVRLDRAHHRPVAGDSPQAEAIKLIARAHQSMIWDRSRHVLRLRAALREFFPAALQAFADLDAPDTLELLALAPDPGTAAALSQSRIAAVLGRARRRAAAAEAQQIQAVLRAPQLRQPPPVEAAYAAIVAGEVTLIRALNTQIDELGEVVSAHFGQHRDAEIYRSQPGLGTILGARVLAEFGDDTGRYASPRHARTTPARHPSLAPPAPGKWSWPATRATAALPTRCTSGRSAPCAATRRPRLLPGPTRPRHRPPGRTARAQQPPGRNPARLPPNTHPLRRDHRLGDHLKAAA